MVEAELLSTKRAVTQNLLSIEGVSGVGAASSTERVIIYVKEAKPDILQKIPETVGGFPVEIIEAGEIMSLQLLASLQNTSRMRPAPGGVSIGHFSITAGTLGSRVFDVAGNRLILSNNHVLAASDTIQNSRAVAGDSILQPGPTDGGTPANDTVASLLRWVKLNEIGTNIVDCALARPGNPADLDDGIIQLGPALGQNFSLADGDKVKKQGRTTGLTNAKILDTNATIKVNYGPFEATFDDQIITDVMGSGGDSGSVLLNESNEAVGLLFAGSPSITAHNKIENVLSALQVSFGAVPPPVPPASFAGGPMLFALAGGFALTAFADRIFGRR